MVRPLAVLSTRTTLIGRDADLARLQDLVTTMPVVTLTGPGGVGKTRLAIELARRLQERFPAGVALVDLSTVESGDAVAGRVAPSFGVVPGSGEPVELLVEQLGDRDVLLVLDNCEHVATATADLVHRLVSACAHTRVLCTAREPLGLGAEVTYPVGPLPATSHGTRLFCERARAADPGFVLADDARNTVGTICERLDGVPLAIELAAPWVRMYTPAELLPRLTDRFDILVGARRDVPPRHRTMLATVAWSHDLLTPEQRVLFRRLSVFNGTFDMTATEAVAGHEPLSPARVPAVLGELNERSMLVVDRSAGDRTRYRLLETLRDFAALRLEEAGEAGECRHRHLRHYLSRAETVDEQRMQTGSDAGVAALVRDGDNHRAALRWSIDHDPARALRLAAALEPFWMIRSVAEGRDWVQRAVDGAPSGDTHLARALVVAPLVVAGGLPWTRCRSMVETSIRIYRTAGDEVGEAMASLTGALSALFHGELDAAEQTVVEARQRHRHLELPLFRARSTTYLGAVRSFVPRRREEGRHLLDEGRARSLEIGDGWGRGMALAMLGLADLRAGHRERARGHLRAVLESNLQAGVTATAVGGTGAADGDPMRSVTLLEAATALRQRTGVDELPVPVERQLSAARRAALGRLPPQLAETCRVRGRTMTTDEVLAYALTEQGLDTRSEASRRTVRQQEIALLVATGLTNREIAERLHLSVRTVETHVNNILTELGLHRRVRLAGWARDAGLLGSPT